MRSAAAVFQAKKANNTPDVIMEMRKILNKVLYR
jgi:hypothetical protein